ncbi:hypothetical protein LTR10_020133 [Elasticomyces elasticus]|uniref:Transcription factor domain-containing protein n=1 Tax=Exophiala sideris TaxID=1016849 RepID=A0ABR0IVV4_9EURO|nr:hypothetical protein LTR10_020133 [Elasticomyces elasticus]KAK5021594.1 hypothetical protein LTS07_010891 [Exophiala sideris]KAK5049731.1 hypothetical protein LTR69_010915 [Exophiala sideris]KAK5176712.1 hypothetical protein LTR44_010782 [Eurotiomycetes sp. CCFEE 6388]
MLPLTVCLGNGGTDGPCTNCLDRNQDCVSSTPRRWRRVERSREPDGIAERLARVEALLKQQPLTHASTNLDPLLDLSIPLTSDCFSLLDGNDPESMIPRRLPNQINPVATNDEGSQSQNLHYLAFPGPQELANSSAIRETGSLLAQRNSAYPADTTSSSLEWTSSYAPSTPFDPPNAMGPGGESPEEIRERCCISSNEIRFFEEALESALGIVHRPWFEMQLKSYFTGAINDVDPAWYALRNVVYAFGCRIQLAKCSSFRDATQSAWVWFENALSVHTEVLYFRTSIVGVQALTLMLIDDDDVSCQVPTSAPPNSTVNVEYFNILIRLARLSSLVSKRLSTVRAFQQGPESVVRSVAELDEQLDALRNSIDPTISNSTETETSLLSSSMTLQQISYLRSTLFSLTLDMHTSLTYPWSRSMLGLTPCATLRDQVNRSTQIVAETCRKAILASDHVQFDAGTPVPLFFGPIHALINLFLYILQDPQRPGVQSDLALMDMGAGYFARVQFLTDSEVSVSFAREMASLAHEATEKISRRQDDNARIAYSQDLPNLPPIRSTSKTDQAQLVEDQLPNDQTAGDIGTSWDIEWESWSTFLPTDDDSFMI